METKTCYATQVMLAVVGVTFLFVIAGSKTIAAQTVAHGGQAAKALTQTVDIVRDPTDVPSAIANRAPTLVRVTLTAKEIVGMLDPSSGTLYRYWTFNGKVPGPLIRVKQGDTVEVTVRNDAHSHMVHSVDFHAALGPGGGAVFSQVIPGQSKTFTFQATSPGLFVYHCGTPMIAEHIANGMYGLILVEPPDGLPHADHEYYVMQGEIYTTVPRGKVGLQQFSNANLLQETPEYFVFNGAVDSLTKEHPMHAKVGETVRIFFGNAGPNATSSLHVVGAIFTRDYVMGSLSSTPLIGIQTVGVPPGSAAIVELMASVPGELTMMDHAMSRMAKGLMATLEVTGSGNATLMHAGTAEFQSGRSALSAWVTGMSQADSAAVAAEEKLDPGIASNVPNSPTNPTDEVIANPMKAMPIHVNPVKGVRTGRSDSMPNGSTAKAATSRPMGLNGCLTLLNDGKVMLRVFPSSKIYRLEAQPFLFSENANRLVHVTGEFGSVVAVEDPNIPSFVVKTVDELAPNCSAKITPALLRHALAKTTKPNALGPLTVGMSDMAFLPKTITIKVGQTVTWRNSSQAIHNVVDDAGKALNMADVHIPDGGKPFDSGLLQPGQAFAVVFTSPGTYRYVCTLHEGNGMKGVVVVK